MARSSSSRARPAREGGDAFLAALGAPPAFGPSFARELAAADVVSGTLGSLRSSYEDPHPSIVLSDKADRSLRLGEFYGRMLDSDLDLASYAAKRVDAVLRLPRRIVPRDSTPLALEIARFCHRRLEQVSELRTNLEHQLGAVSFGTAFDEVVWERLSRGPDAGAAAPVAITDRPMHRFLFRKGRLHVRRPIGTEPVAPPLGKFLHLRMGTKESGWGAPLLDKVYPAWFLKRNGLKFYAIFLDKWAQPTAKGTYRHREGDTKTNEENQSRLLEVLERIQTEYSIVLPEGLEVGLLEASRSGSANYEQFIALLNRSQALAYLGEVDTSGAAKGPGSFAKAEVSNDVRLEKVELDAHALASSLRDDLLRPLVWLNYGLDAPVPDLVIDTLEGEDRSRRVEQVGKLLDLGLPAPRRFVYAAFQVPEPLEGEEVVLKPARAPVAAPADPPPVPSAAAASAAAPRADAVRLASTPEGAREVAALEKLARRRDGELDQVASFFADRTVAYYAGWREILVEAFDSGAVADRSALRYLAGKLNPLEQARAIQTAQTHGLGFGLSHVVEDIGLDAVRLGSTPPWQGATTPDAAATYWSQVLTVPPETFSGYDDASRRLAFSIAGVNDLNLLLEVHGLIGQTLAEGWDRSRFVAALDDLFKRRGLSPLARWHAELVYANATRTAAGLMRYRQLVGNPTAKRLTPYLIWLSLFDGRERPEHHLMHEFVAAIDDPIWQTWWTPAGHNCRCAVGTINLAKARRLGYVGSRPTGDWPLFEGLPVLPDPGFRGVPGFGDLALDRQIEAAQTRATAEATGDFDLIEALLQLFAQFFGSSTTTADFVAAARVPGRGEKAA